MLVIPAANTIERDVDGGLFDLCRHQDIKMKEGQFSKQQVTHTTFNLFRLPQH
jgi:hypothetical protein